ncbi:MAG: cupin domain-containing protein [Nitrososphaerales archaeon]|nr:cupin domain-containing protein [Nitrososphaerales archaeon]
MTLQVKEVKEYLPNVVALWDVFETLIPPNPGKLVQTHVWNGKEIIERLRKVAYEVKLGPEVERKVLVPVNPGLQKLGLFTATHTIYVGFQIVLPGEVADAHRHTPFASRFMIKGKAETTVDGVRVEFEEGDYITTPRWAWHDHTNKTKEPVIWLDALDTPIPKMLLASFFEDYEGHAQPVTGDLLARFESTGLAPAFSMKWVRSQNSPLMFKWKDVHSMLMDLAATTEGSPTDGITLTYKDPRTGKEVSDSLGADITLLKSGFRTKSHRHTTSAVYYVVKGKGAIVADGKELLWRENDVISLTPWMFHELMSDGGGDSILFSLNDRPILTGAGLYREQLGP